VGNKILWGSGAAMPPPNFVVPNIAFTEPYAHFPQPQQSVAIIGGYAARNMQNIAAIQTNTAQLGEGNANIAYEFGHLHLAPPGEFIGGAVQSYYEQGYNNQDYQYQPPRKIRDRRTFSYHSFSLFL
jgi:apolipoprotein N-acyltransferase